MDNIKQKIIEKRAEISVIGMGYVGLPIAVCLANKGFNVIGYDIDKKKISSINSGKNPLIEEKWLNPIMERVIYKNKLTASNNMINSGNSDVIIIAVPTPAIDGTSLPDYSYVSSSINNISKRLKEGSLISLESTVGPGTTRGLVSKIIKKETGFSNPHNYNLVFSPERIDPGNSMYNVTNIQKIVGGFNKESTKIGSLLYKNIVPTTIEVNSPEEAEFAKLLENTYRDVNIALANEFAMMLDNFKDENYSDLIKNQFLESIDLTFYPGLVGGHCIPHDPWFLIHSLAEKGEEMKLVKAARLTNQKMSDYISSKINKLFWLKNKNIEGSNIAILGLSYKENISDTRSSPGKELAKLLSKHGANIKAYDPYVKKDDEVPLCPSLYSCISNTDAIILVTSHDEFLNELPICLENKPNIIFYDVRNKINFNGHNNGILVKGLGRNYLDIKRLKKGRKRLNEFLSSYIRYVNVALAREFSVASKVIGHTNIDTVINAASTKPFGYRPVFPNEEINGERQEFLEKINGNYNFKFQLLEIAKNYFNGKSAY